MTATPCGIYLRVSRAHDGTTIGVDRQRPPTEALVRRLGWQVGQVYVENDTSAKRGASRPVFDRMVNDAKAGRIAAIAVWADDRFSRNERDGLTLLDLHDDHGVKLVTTSDEWDLSKASGRRDFRSAMNASIFYSERQTERMLLMHNGLRQEGRKAGGPRSYGFEGTTKDGEGRITNPRTAGIAHVPDEVAVIVECASRLLAGESAAAIVADLNRRELPTSTGARWSTSTLRRVLVNPRVAGYRAHSGELVAAEWEPVLDRSTWERVKGVYAPTTARRKLGPRRRHLLSGGVTVCGLCGHPLDAGTAGRDLHRVYRCDTGHGGCGRISISAEALDDHVTDELLAALAGPRLAALRAAARSADVATHAAALTAEIDASDRELITLARLHGERRIRLEEWLAAREPIEQRAEAARAEAAALPTADVLANLPTTHDKLVKAWAAWTVEQQRELVIAAITRVTVGSGLRGGRGVKLDRVSIDWRA